MTNEWIWWRQWLEVFEKRNEQPAAKEWENLKPAEAILEGGEDLGRTHDAGIRGRSSFSDMLLEKRMRNRQRQGLKHYEPFN